MNRIFIIGLMASLLLVHGQDQLFVGTRPLSMGGAFIAVADDSNLCLHRHIIETACVFIYVSVYIQCYIA